MKQCLVNPQQFTGKNISLPIRKKSIAYLENILRKNYCDTNTNRKFKMKGKKPTCRGIDQFSSSQSENHASSDNVMV